MKTINKITTILILAFITTAFTTRDSNAECSDDYLCIYAYNLDTQKIIISNIFKCSEFETGMGALSNVTVGEYLESEYGFEVKSYRDIQVFINSGENYVYESRNKAINDARDKGYGITKIKVYCKDGLIYDKCRVGKGESHP